jgi:hypothetical protein
MPILSRSLDFTYLRSIIKFIFLVRLPEELIDETNRVEEEIIKNEVIRALAKAINPIISQIQRELLLILEIDPMIHCRLK